MRLATRVDRRFASDARAGIIARTHARQRHRVVLRQQWRPLLVTALISGVGTLVGALLARDPTTRGLVLGAGITGTIGILSGLVVLLAGTAPLLAGELAEQWTAEQLRGLRCDGWRLLNHLGLGFGDIDHLLLGPHGLLLLETKWGSNVWALDQQDAYFQSALQQVQRNARQLTLWHGVAQHGRPEVTPVLVLWGPAQDSLDEHKVRRHSSGVTVIQGQHLRTWLRDRTQQQPNPQLTPEQVDKLWTALVRQAGKRDDYEQRTRPLPPSITGLFLSLLGSLCCAGAGILASTWLLTLTHDLRVWIGGTVAATVLLESVRRRSRWRLHALATQTGLLGTLLLGLLAGLLAYVS